MSLPTALSMTQAQHTKLQDHLFPGDGKEAVALALCGHRLGDLRHRLMVRHIELIPHAACPIRTSDQVTWRPNDIAHLLDRATSNRLCVVKIHSHPGGYPVFSDADTEGDFRLLPMIKGWVEAGLLHGSAVMLPEGAMFGRVLNLDDRMTPIDVINVVGDNLRFWYAKPWDDATPGYMASHAQLFDQGTIERLRRLWVAVIGCSGTGSPVVEQLVRLGVGVIFLIDDDRLEDRNINRILNSTMEDARQERFKVDVLSDSISRIGLGTTIIRISKNLWSPEVVRQVAQCDLAIGCMDTIDGRYLLNQLTTLYTMPYLDLGIRLDAVPSGPQKGRIREICGSINFLQPGRSSLMSRGLFSMQDVADAGLLRTDPQAHAQKLKDGYIKGVPNHRPAVISVNMLAASLGVNELLGRLHPYREEGNAAYARTTFSLSSMELISDEEGPPCDVLARHVGLGDVRPILLMPELSDRATA